ncbi:MAG TPA: hypothetical protein VIA61_15115 [Methylomirabilota bacterium]|jgi:hypothetical protein
MDLHHLLVSTGIVVAGVLAVLSVVAYRLGLGGRGTAAAHEINNPLAAGRIRDAVAPLGRIVRVEATHPVGTLPPILDTTRSSEKSRDDARR